MSRLTLALATAKRWPSSNLNNNVRGLSHKIRALLREMAQPVAVVTSFMPSTAQPRSSAQASSTPSAFHGATLSSFTSISMAPHHLVAFSLRVPSRMATALAELSSAADPSSPAHMVINLLAAPQAHAAILFSRPDLHPRPFEDPGIQWSLSEDSLPILHDSLGALSCRVVGAPSPLNDLATLGDKLLHKAEGTCDSVDADGVESELFIAQVMRVEDVPQAASVGYDDTIRTLPLVYHRRGYTTTADKLPLNQEADN
jgi:flavin reductase (DIM6/NTAB) family NADH-FMN oxidoreductase RutF